MQKKKKKSKTFLIVKIIYELRFIYVHVCSEKVESTEQKKKSLNAAYSITQREPLDNFGILPFKTNTDLTPNTTCSHTCTHRLTDPHMCEHAHPCRLTHSCMHTYLYTLTHTPTYVCTHSCAHAFIPVHTLPYVFILVCSQTHTLTHVSS